MVVYEDKKKNKPSRRGLMRLIAFLIFLAVCALGVFFNFFSQTGENVRIAGATTLRESDFYFVSSVYTPEPYGYATIVRDTIVSSDSTDAEVVYEDTQQISLYLNDEIVLTYTTYRSLDSCFALISGHTGNINVLSPNASIVIFSPDERYFAVLVHGIYADNIVTVNMYTGVFDYTYTIGATGIEWVDGQIPELLVFRPWTDTQLEVMPDWQGD